MFSCVLGKEKNGVMYDENYHAKSATCACCGKKVANAKYFGHVSGTPKYLCKEHETKVFKFEAYGNESIGTTDDAITTKNHLAKVITDDYNFALFASIAFKLKIYAQNKSYILISSEENMSRQSLGHLFKNRSYSTYYKAYINVNGNFEYIYDDDEKSRHDRYTELVKRGKVKRG